MDIHRLSPAGNIGREVNRSRFSLRVQAAVANLPVFVWGQIEGAGLFIFDRITDNAGGKLAKMLSGTQKEGGEAGENAAERVTKSLERQSGKVAYSTGDKKDFRFPSTAPCARLLVSYNRRRVRRIPALRGLAASGLPPPKRSHHRPFDRRGFLLVRRKLDQMEQVDNFTVADADRFLSWP